MIVINSAETANDLLERRSLIYSGRYLMLSSFCETPNLPMCLGLRPSWLLNCGSKRANQLRVIYTDRYSIWGYSMGWHWHLAALPYGEEFRTGRRLFHREFNPQASLRFRPLQLDVTHDLLRRLVVSPDQYSEHIIQSVLSQVADTYISRSLP